MSWAFKAFAVNRGYLQLENNCSECFNVLILPTQYLYKA
jgi:hypothetical protein